MHTVGHAAMSADKTIWILSVSACALVVALLGIARYSAGELSWVAGWLISFVGWLFLASVIIPACSVLKQMEFKMKYVVAVIACGGLFLLYVIIGVGLGWRRGGGIIPMMILLSVVGAAWAAITRSSSSTDQTKKEPELKSPPKPFAGFQDIPQKARTDSAENKRLSDGRR